MSETLAFRALQDRLTKMQLDIDQMKRNTAMGTAIQWQPIPGWTGIGFTIDDPDAVGFWVRHGALFIAWFVTRTTGNSSDGVGTFRIRLPPVYDNTGVPVGFLQLEEFGGPAHPYAGISDIGHWHTTDGLLDGWIAYGISLTEISLMYRSGGAAVEASDAIFNKNTVIRGHIVAKIAPGF